MKKVLALLAVLLIPALASAEEVTTETINTETPTIDTETTQENTEEETNPKTDLEFTYYWGDGCSHCAKVNAYFAQNDILKKYNVKKKEIYNDKNNQMEFQAVLNALGVERWGVPFFVIYDKTKEDSDPSRFSYLSGDTPVINMFKDFEKGNTKKALEPKNNDENNGANDLTEQNSNNEDKSNNAAAMLLILGLVILAGFGGLIFYKGK